MTAAHLSASGVSVVLGGRTVVDAVSLDLRPGEVAAIMSREIRTYFGFRNFESHQPLHLRQTPLLLGVLRGKGVRTVLIDDAAALTTSGVRRFRAPRSSSSPQRPQLFLVVFVSPAVTIPPIGVAVDSAGLTLGVELGPFFARPNGRVDIGRPGPQGSDVGLVLRYGFERVPVEESA